jgi:hypothetical protein
MEGVRQVFRLWDMTQIGPGAPWRTGAENEGGQSESAGPNGIEML